MRYVVSAFSLFLPAPIGRHVGRGFEFGTELAKSLPFGFLDFAVKSGFIRQKAEAGEESVKML